MFMDAFAVAALYVRLQYLLGELIPIIRQEISEDSYTCDYLDGKAVQVGNGEKWVPESKPYQLIVGPRDSFATNVRKLYSNLHNVTIALGQINVDSMLLGLPADMDYDRLREELVTILAKKPEKLAALV
jgi:hypothetical protein